MIGNKHWGLCNILDLSIRVEDFYFIIYIRKWCLNLWSYNSTSYWRCSKNPINR